jgi:hypothetical protein
VIIILWRAEGGELLRQLRRANHRITRRHATFETDAAPLCGLDLERPNFAGLLDYFGLWRV